MAIGNGITYQGGNDTVLTNFYGGITNAFNRNQARLAKEAENASKLQAENQKQLDSIVKKVNTNGVQKQDVPEMTKKLDEIYDTYYKANKAATNAERISLRMDLEKKITDMGSFVSSSKERGQRFIKIADQMATKPQLFSPEARQAYMNNVDIPTSKLSADDLNLNRYITPDTKYLATTIDQVVKETMAGADTKLVVGKAGQIGNNSGTYTQDVKSATTEQLGTNLFKKYGTDSGFANLIDFEAEKVGMTPQNYLVEQAKEIQKTGVLTQSKQDFKNNRVPRASKGSGSDDTDGFVVEQNYQLNYGSRSTTVDGKGDNAPVVSTVNAREFVGIPTAPTITAGKFNTMVDSQGNKYDARNLTEELKLVGIATVPVLKRSSTERQRQGGKVISSTTLNAGAIATDKFAKANPNAVTYVKRAIVSKKSKNEEDETITTTYFADPKEVVPRTKLTKGGKAALSEYEKTFQQNSGGTIR